MRKIASPQQLASRHHLGRVRIAAGEATRQLQGFTGDLEQFEKLQSAANHIQAATESLLQGSNEFLGIKMTGLTPDGLLGGSGYARKVGEVRGDLMDICHKI